MEHSTRNSLLIAALVLLVLAIALRMLIGGASLADEVASELKKHGCSIASDALYQQSYSRQSSIAELMEGVSLDEAIEASLSAGFPSNTEREGELYLLLAQLDDERVLTVFIIDEQIELAFIQKVGSDEVLPINAADTNH